ncbi:MAG: hypothetical protein K6E19_11220 [Lachnospiraceae bacterium]|nr:hypothetical protein [Lachnospiraceae bacterium]
MINEERVRLMTRMASYADNEGRANSSIISHFRSDYLGLQVLKAVICATIAYMIAFAVYIYYDFENFMVNIYKIDLFDFAATVLKRYLLFMAVYCIIVYIAFAVKYGKAHKVLKKYFNNLKLLATRYTEE